MVSTQHLWKQMNCCQLKKWSFESQQWAIKLRLNTLLNRLSTLANWTLAKRLVSETTDIRLIGWKAGKSTDEISRNFNTPSRRPGANNTRCYRILYINQRWWLLLIAVFSLPCACLNSTLSFEFTRWKTSNTGYVSNFSQVAMPIERSK